MDVSSRQTVSKEIMDLNNTVDQMNLINIQNIPSNSTWMHIFLRYKWNILQDTTYVGHKPSLIKIKIEIIPSIFSFHSDIKLEINNWRKIGKFTNMYKLNYTYLNRQRVKEEIKRKIKKHLIQTKIETQHTKIYGIQTKQFNRNPVD